MWKLEFDEDFFRIYDQKKMVAGYFDPDYGDIFNVKDYEEIIERMLKNHDEVPGGLLMVPMVKFRLFDTDLNVTVHEVEENVIRVAAHLEKWKSFLAATATMTHHVRISHTDQDMLTIAFPVSFPGPTPLRAAALAARLEPTLDLLQKSGLL